MVTSMKGTVRRSVRSTLRRLRSNETVSNALYDLTNEDQFSTLCAHERMLADPVRVDTYAAGIERHVEAGDVVVDLGTGTGILAFLAAQQGATVHAIDHAEIIEIAKIAAEYNGIEHVEFHQTNSREFTCSEAVDVILHEQMGAALFDENMLENVLDLKRRVLADDGRVLPARFELFAEPVRVNDDSRVPYLWEEPVHDVSFEFLDLLGETNEYRQPSHSWRFVGHEKFESFLSEPEPVLSVDLDDMSDGSSVPTEFEVARTVTEPGEIDGICLFFRTVFDDETQFDTSPDEAGPTSWGNPLFRTPIRTYANGERISYRVSIGDLSDVDTWSVSLAD
ncbi:methyltransferase domain-containing protein [Halorubrum tibetense]|uniref:Methyltransferase domain-containing protein n=1 Tax=Halorubrum tibetense TaxID=175631 RepID=A0ABD5S8F6_9EURY